MANGDHWWATFWEYAQGAIATIATAASSAVGWMAWRYRTYVSMLSSHETHLKRHRRALKRILKVLNDNENGQKNARAIKDCERHLKQMQAEMDALNTEVGKCYDLALQGKGSIDSQLVMVQGLVRELEQMRSRFDQVLTLMVRRDRPDE
jgi:hypothetical protein